MRSISKLSTFLQKRLPFFYALALMGMVFSYGSQAKAELTCEGGQCVRKTDKGEEYCTTSCSNSSLQRLSSGVKVQDPTTGGTGISCSLSGLSIENGVIEVGADLDYKLTVVKADGQEETFIYTGTLSAPSSTATTATTTSTDTTTRTTR